MAEKRVLAVGVDTSTLNLVPSDLIGEAFELDLVPTSKSATTLATSVRFDLIVMRHPLGDLDLRSFLRILRGQSSKSREVKLMLLADDPHHHELQDLHAHAVEVVAKDEALIGDLTSKALGGAPRFQLKIMVRLEIELPYGRSIRICQSENLSESGMLVRTEDTFPVGTVGLASFRLPAAAEATEVRVRVIRETVAGEIPGIALHFEDFQEGSDAALKAFVATQLAL